MNICSLFDDSARSLHDDARTPLECRALPSTTSWQAGIVFHGAHSGLVVMTVRFWPIADIGPERPLPTQSGHLSEPTSGIAAALSSSMTLTGTLRQTVWSRVTSSIPYSPRTASTIRRIQAVCAELLPATGCSVPDSSFHRTPVAVRQMYRRSGLARAQAQPVRALDHRLRQNESRPVAWWPLRRALLHSKGGRRMSASGRKRTFARATRKYVADFGDPRLCAFPKAIGFLQSLLCSPQQTLGRKPLIEATRKVMPQR